MTTNYSLSLRAKAELERRRRAAARQASPEPDFGQRTNIAWQRAAFPDESPIILATGSAGGGKSRFAAEKLHHFLKTYPGATGLALRKAREFANKSIIPFLKQTVIKKDADYKAGERAFYYPNGSVLYIGGMSDDNQRESVRSIGGDGGLDVVWLEEANAFSELDFNELIARMRGKAAHYTQFLLSTNPDAPNHWINQRFIIGGGAKVYYSGALDNPHNPPEYIEHLKTLTGILYQRLVLGLWVQAEGVIFDNFDPARNVTPDAEYNPDWPVIWGVDDGYAKGEGVGYASYHPRVILLGQVTPQGGVHIFHAYYATQELSEVSLNNVLELPYPRPDIAYVDSSAVELRGRMWERDIQTAGATHKVSEGIKNVRRMICDGNGVRLLKIHPRCVHLINEMQSYRYDDSSKSVDIGEPKPMKLDDHGPDTLRYMTWHLRYTD